MANDVSKPGIGFGSEENEITIIGRDGVVDSLPRQSKIEVAGRILDRVRQALGRV